MNKDNYFINSHFVLKANGKKTVTVSCFVLKVKPCLNSVLLKEKATITYQVLNVIWSAISNARAICFLFFCKAY